MIRPSGDDDMNTVFSKDLYRYYGDEGESLAQKMLRPPELRYIALLRKTNACKFRLLKLFYMVRLKLLSYKTLIQIPVRTEIGEGFYIGHLGRLIIHPDAKLGKNINVGTGVTIGQENRGKRKGTPTLKGDCWIGTNSVIVGNIQIGEDVLIAPLTFVNFDVPDHSIVIGNPGVVRKKENAVLGYVGYCV
jgi:serine O-acetyltransferase